MGTWYLGYTESVFLGHGPDSCGFFGVPAVRSKFIKTQITNDFHKNVIFHIKNLALTVKSSQSWWMIHEGGTVPVINRCTLPFGQFCQAGQHRGH